MPKINMSENVEVDIDTTEKGFTLKEVNYDCNLTSSKKSVIVKNDVIWLMLPIRHRKDGGAFVGSPSFKSGKGDFINQVRGAVLNAASAWLNEEHPEMSDSDLEA